MQQPSEGILRKWAVSTDFQEHRPKICRNRLHGKSKSVIIQLHTTESYPSITETEKVLEDTISFAATHAVNKKPN